MQSVPWEKWWSGAGRKPSKRKRGRLELDPEAREKVCAGMATETAAILLQNSGQCGMVHRMVCGEGAGVRTEEGCRSCRCGVEVEDSLKLHLGS